MKVRAAVTVLSLALMLPLAVPPPADARSRVPAQVLAQAEMSLRVQGTITIEADGTVSRVTLAENRALKPELQAFVERQVGSWQFVVPGQQSEQLPISLRLVSRPDGEGMTVRIVSAHFGDDSALAPSQRLVALERTPPRYPRDVYQVGGTGMVLLLQKVGPDGRVMESSVRQVNLTRAGTEQAMRRIRERLAQVSLEASRNWTYQVPTEGPDAGKPYWVVSVPVNFELSDMRPPVYNRGWQAYLPGPRLDIPWYQRAASDQAMALEAMPEDRPTLLGSANPAPVLKTPLGG